MDMIRRTVLKGAGATGVLAGLLAAGVLKPTLAYANDWNKAAFDAKDLDEALKAIGGTGAADNKDLVMKAPEIAENGAVVPVDVTSNIPNTTSIAPRNTCSRSVMPERVASRSTRCRSTRTRSEAMTTPCSSPPRPPARACCFSATVEPTTPRIPISCGTSTPTPFMSGLPPAHSSAPSPARDGR